MKEQRRYVRFTEVNRIIIEMSGNGNGEGEASVDAFTNDLSLGGMMLETDRSIVPGTELNLTIFLSRSSQAVKIRGNVKWAKEIDDGLHHLGIEFIHDTPGAFISLLGHLYGKQTKIPTTIHTPINSIQI